MNTTLIAMDKISMKILEHCGAIADVTCTQVTQPEALSKTDEMLITISHGDDSAWLAKPRSSAFEQELNYVIIPYEQREKLEEIHKLAAGRNIVFIPQLPIKAANENDYYSRCVVDSAASIKALTKLVKSYNAGMIGIDKDDLAKVLSYGENTYKAIFSVRGIGENPIEDCIEKVRTHRLVKVMPVMTLYEAFFPSDSCMQQLEQLDSAFDKSMSGLMLDESDPEVIIVAVYDKAPE